ncbi:Calmodulin [Hexamita inflata]|uniref:Calmodulin n=1 Tax=Hexamita inflata TaxID=28002 RepID=A0AA86TZJ0_9EUKA|nr:Calmodulin [Hexamita inflata]
MDEQIIFKQMDKNNTGKLTLLQTQQCLQKLGYQFSDQDMKLIITVFDINNNGLIEYTEFKQMLYTIDNLKQVNIEQILFYATDLDQNKLIDMREFKLIIQKLKIKLTDEQSTQYATRLGLDKQNFDYDKFQLLLKIIKEIYAVAK